MKNSKPLSRFQMMKIHNTPTVREAVESGMKVSLPNLLDAWYLWKEDDTVREYDILWYMASEVANDHDLTHNQATGVVHYTLTSLGVDLGANA